MDDPSRQPRRGRSDMPRVLPAIFAMGFAAIGAVLIVSLWSGAMSLPRPGAMPARLIGSIMALMFIVAGVTVARRLVRGGRSPHRARPPAAPGGAGNVCPHCGAALVGEADVSPHGDVKCPYCDAWYNVHGR